RDRNVTGVQTCALPIFLSRIDDLCPVTNYRLRPFRNTRVHPWDAHSRSDGTDTGGPQAQSAAGPQAQSAAEERMQNSLPSVSSSTTLDSLPVGPTSTYRTTGS